MRTAYITFKSADNKQVCITVKHQGNIGSNSEAGEIPQLSPLNKAFYENWYQGDNKEVYITVSQNKYLQRPDQILLEQHNEVLRL